MKIGTQVIFFGRKYESKYAGTRCCKACKMSTSTCHAGNLPGPTGKRDEGEAPTAHHSQPGDLERSEFRAHFSSPLHRPPMEIPTAVIHRLQSTLREAAGAPAADAAPAPPFPTVADAVAAFDSGAASEGVRCGRCGAAGGLLRGAKSALCAYCGCPRRGEEVEGGGIAFRDGAAYRWLLGSLGLDGSVSSPSYIIRHESSLHLGLVA